MMVVLLDLEWIEDHGNNLTQLSAVRTDENWREVSRLDRLVRTPPECLRLWRHMAFGGYPAERFADAAGVEECMADFQKWLAPDDVIVVWADSNLQFLSELWERYLGTPVPNMRYAANKARSAAEKKHLPARNPYAILAGFGERLPRPEHRSSNDVDVMRRVFSRLGLNPAQFESMPVRKEKTPPPPVQRKPLTQRERNQKTIDHSKYNYIYLTGSEVFHRRDCKC